MTFIGMFFGLFYNCNRIASDGTSEFDFIQTDADLYEFISKRTTFVDYLRDCLLYGGFWEIGLHEVPTKVKVILAKLQEGFVSF
jgi:hypothetical protein